MSPHNPAVSTLFAVSLAGLLGGGCATSLADRYEAAISDAAVVEPGEATALQPVAGERAVVVTWVATKYADSYVSGQEVTLAWGETWVTRDGQVKVVCTGVADPQLRVEQLLGLPPNGPERAFVTLDVTTADLFRPCADPDISHTSCGERFPDNTADAHRVWYADQTAGAYRAGGYPWTRLGYTYDWSDSSGEVGLEELVIRRGATAKVLGVVGTAAYCAQRD